MVKKGEMLETVVKESHKELSLRYGSWEWGTSRATARYLVWASEKNRYQLHEEEHGRKKWQRAGWWWELVCLLITSIFWLEGTGYGDLCIILKTWGFTQKTRVLSLVMWQGPFGTLKIVVLPLLSHKTLHIHSAYHARENLSFVCVSVQPENQYQ